MFLKQVAHIVNTVYFIVSLCPLLHIYVNISSTYFDCIIDAHKVDFSLEIFLQKALLQSSKLIIMIFVSTYILFVLYVMSRVRRKWRKWRKE